MKILKDEKKLLEQRERDCFERFIDRCNTECKESWVGVLCNPFEEVCQDLENKIDPLVLGSLE